MSFETPPQLKIEIEDGYENTIPEEFKTDPFTYFESNGNSLKSKEKDALKVKVKSFLWGNLPVVAKIVSVDKHPEDPFHEYKIMKAIKEIGLPGPKPISTIESDGKFMIITERIPGISKSGLESLKVELISKGATDEDIKNMLDDAEVKTSELREVFEAAGIHKDPTRDNWKRGDMVFEVDIANKKVLGVTPTDFEHTQIDV